jgi:protocatechuate 3,4-dioxygenase beta subunit
MYFEGDPLIKQCPIVKTINNDEAVRTLIAELDTHAAVPLDCLAYRFDLVLRGHRATLFENRTQGPPDERVFSRNRLADRRPLCAYRPRARRRRFHIFEKNFGPQLTTPDTEGERITIEGRVIDGSGTPVRDVLLELWQANAAGRYHHPDDRQHTKSSIRAFAAGVAAARTLPPASGALRPSSREPSSVAMAG